MSEKTKTIRSMSDMLVLVAEYIFELQKVGVLNDKVVYTDFDTVGGVCDFELDIDRIKHIIKQFNLTVLYNQEEDLWEAKNVSAMVHCCSSNFDIAICSAALYVKGWREDPTQK
jgi:hypothetical protein